MFLVSCFSVRQTAVFEIMKSPAQAAKASSRKARLSAARLAAAQAVYQMIANQQGAVSVTEEFIERRLGQPLDGAAMVMPDGVLFRDIVRGVDERRADLDELIQAAARKPDAALEPETAQDPEAAQNEAVFAAHEPLLRAVVLCGAYELLAHGETDAPIIIADYLHVTHAFFDQGEARLVNAILDQIRRAVRD